MLIAELTVLGAVGMAFLILFVAMFLVLFIFLFVDVFGRDDLTGWAKAGWVLLLVVLPLIGSLIYIVARTVEGSHERSRAMARQAAVTER